MNEYTVEIGKDRGSYKVRYRFTNLHQAVMMYEGLLVTSGLKKRLRRNGCTLMRELST